MTTYSNAIKEHQGLVSISFQESVHVLQVRFLIQQLITGSRGWMTKAYLERSLIGQVLQQFSDQQQRSLSVSLDCRRAVSTCHIESRFVSDLPGSGTMPADSGEAMAGHSKRKNIKPAAATSSLPGNFSPTAAHNILQT